MKISAPSTPPPRSTADIAPLVAPPDRPDVCIFPPVLPIGGLVTGVLLEWAFPLADRVPWLPNGVRQISATVFILSGAALIATSRAAMMRAKTNVNPRLPSLQLVQTGPFSWMRNPMYLGGNLASLGVGLAFRLPWMLLLFPLLLVICHYGVVLREERYLEGKFGADYVNYKKRVRRWL